MRTQLNAALFKCMARTLASRWNPENKVASLYFHHIHRKGRDPFSPDDLDIPELESLIEVLRQHFFFIGADEELPTHAPAIMLTFDDGYLDNREAAAFLEDIGIKANFFIASAGMEKGFLWQDVLSRSFKIDDKEALRITKEIAGDLNVKLGHIPIKRNGDEKSAARTFHEVASYVKYWAPHAVDEMESALVELFGVPYWCMLQENEVHEISRRGHVIGAHTHNHRILTTLTKEEAIDEVMRSKEALESATFKPVKCFAYPNGAPQKDFTERDVEIVKNAGFSCAYTTQDGGISANTDPYQRGRFLPYRRHPLLRAMSTIKIAGE
mgnify:FL=1